MGQLREMTRFSATIIIAAMFLAPSFTSLAIAAPNANKTITVDTTTDSNNSAYQKCTTSANDCSLRGAISKANADASNTYTINLPANTYTLTLAGANEDNNATGDLDILTNLTISGALPATTIIDANNIDRVIHVNGLITVWIKNVTIKNGRAPNGPPGPPGFNQGSSGGGIFNIKATLNMEECFVTNNRAGNGGAGLAGAPPNAGGNGGTGGDGGGIFSSPTSSLTLMDSVVRNNRSGDGGAGGKGSFVAGGPGTNGGNGGNGGSGGGINGLGWVTVSNVLISNNTTGKGGNGGTGGPTNALGLPAGSGGPAGDGGEGGGIFILSYLTMTDSVVDSNQTGDGGKGGTGGTSTAVFLGPGGPGGAGGVGGEGGAIHNMGTATLDNITISHNRAGNGGNGGTGGDGSVPPFFFPALAGGSGGNGGPGGGFYNSGTLNLTNVTVSGNTIGAGGAGGTGGDEVVGSPLFGGPGGNGGNGGAGGGIYSSGTTTNNNTTIVNNDTSSGGAGGASGSPGFAPSGAAGVSGDGGGVFISAGSVSIMNTILANNAAKNGMDCNGNLASQGYNLIEDVTGCSISGSLGGNITGQDPKLEELAENGGSCETHALKLGSPAIDAANPATPGSGGFACAYQDQRYILRPIDGDEDGIAICDIGAFERLDFLYLPLVKK